jgi:hypothetical protein
MMDGGKSFLLAMNCMLQAIPDALVVVVQILNYPGMNINLVLA